MRYLEPAAIRPEAQRIIEEVMIDVVVLLCHHVKMPLQTDPPHLVRNNLTPHGIVFLSMKLLHRDAGRKEISGDCAERAGLALLPARSQQVHILAWCLTGNGASSSSARRFACLDDNCRSILAAA